MTDVLFSLLLTKILIWFMMEWSMPAQMAIKCLLPFRWSDLVAMYIIILKQSVDRTLQYIQRIVPRVTARSTYSPSVRWRQNWQHEGSLASVGRCWPANPLSSRAWLAAAAGLSGSAPRHSAEPTSHAVAGSSLVSRRRSNLVVVAATAVITRLTEDAFSHSFLSKGERAHLLFCDQWRERSDNLWRHCSVLDISWINDKLLVFFKAFIVILANVSFKS